MHHSLLKIAGLIFFLASLPSLSSAQNITFAKVVNLKGAAASRSVALGDFNRDGRPDVAVASSGAVTVFLGNGNGTFTQGASIPFAAAPMFVAAGDFDGDGKLDIAVANNASATLSVLLGNGDGTFGPAITTNLGVAASFSHAITVGDFDRDGNLDIAVTSDTTKGLSILLGHGDGNFDVASQTLSGAATPQSIAAADLDGDGKIDLAIANGSTVLLFTGIGDGTFDPPVDLQLNSSPGFVAMGDFNRDGVPDLAITSLSDKNISILPGNGDGTFGSASKRGVPAIAQFIVVADLNGDGKLDLAVTLDTGVLSVFQGVGDGTFNSGQNLIVKSGSFSAVAADFTGDGKPDILAANSRTSGFSFLANTTAFSPAGAFADASFDITPDEGTSPAHTPIALALGDFDRDGKLDLVTANSGPDNNVSVLLGDGTGSFAPASGTPFDAGTTPAAVATVDFDGDGILDLAVADSGDGKVSIFIGNGDGTFAPASPPTVAVQTTPVGLAIGDFDRDGKPDLAVANSGDDSVSILLGGGDGTFASALNKSVGDAPSALAAGDFNRDGILDLAVADKNDGKVSILLGGGDGTFTDASGSPVTVGTSPSSVAVGDFDGDGMLDLAVANSGGGNVSVLLGNGDGTFAAKVDFNVGASPSSVVAGDWNGDGILDLAVGNAGSDNVSILFGDGAGGFSSLIPNAFGAPFAVGDGPAALVAGDFNRDGKLDLASANANDDTVSILLNATPPPTVIAPASGDTWTIGTTQTIRWTDAPAGAFVNIWLSRDGGVTWKTILKKAANDGSQTWKVTGPATTPNNARIRICTTAKIPVCDAVSDLFTIP